MSDKLAEIIVGWVSYHPTTVPRVSKPTLRSLGDAVCDAYSLDNKCYHAAVVATAIKLVERGRLIVIGGVLQAPSTETAYRLGRRQTGVRKRHCRGDRVVTLDTVRPEVPQEPNWDPEEPTTEELDLEMWARQFCSIPPAGGWASCDETTAAEVAAEVLNNRRIAQIVADGIYHKRGAFGEDAACPSGLVPELAGLESSTPSCPLMMDPAVLVGILVDGERELSNRQGQLVG